MYIELHKRVFEPVTRVINIHDPMQFFLQQFLMESYVLLMLDKANCSCFTNTPVLNLIEMWYSTEQGSLQIYKKIYIII